jgi:hypothetical protein
MESKLDDIEKFVHLSLLKVKNNRSMYVDRAATRVYEDGRTDGAQEALENVLDFIRDYHGQTH